MVKPGEWVWSVTLGQACRVVDARKLWGSVSYQVWVPATGAIILSRADDLSELAAAPASTGPHLAYIAAAARVADSLARDVLLAPLQVPVIPLPHQIRALRRVMSGDRIRYLLADEVGLGKTIEAGLVLRELKLRGLVRRTLVVAPKGLISQWAAELRTHFGEEFRLVLPEDFAAYRKLGWGENLWRAHDQVICSLDSVKPIESRRGWSRDQIAGHNRERFEDLVAAGWDLVVVDEAHRLGGSTDQVARHKLGEGLAGAAPYLLLLSATPHQGKSDAFHRLVCLLDSEVFPEMNDVTREGVRPYVIRTEKRRAIDADGQPLFRPRQTRLVPVAWSSRHRDQRALYEAVTDYVREGYNQALLDKRSYIGFLMLLMQRLVTSSIRAIHATLERRLEVLQNPDEADGEPAIDSPAFDEEWAELDGQAALDALLGRRLAALKNERTEVEGLLELTRRAEAVGPDAKAEALLDWIYQLQREEGDPDLKVLVFTEFVPTQEMLAGYLTERAFSVVCLNGSMGMEERRRVQEAFAGEARVLVSTDAGGEGLNLQFCHVVVNYDLPWNPMRIEQRIGRVDRIGQPHVVRAINFTLDDTVEHRVQEVLQEKLAIILQEFGVDKADDILDSAQAERLFDDLYVEAIASKGDLEARVASVMAEVREQARLAREGLGMLAAEDALDPDEARQVLEHPMPRWIERMVVSYVEGRGGRAVRHDGAWDVTWPDGQTLRNVVFSAREATSRPGGHHLTLEDPRTRALVATLPHFAPGQPIPRLVQPSLPASVQGLWALWRVSLGVGDWGRERIVPLFLSDDGRVFQPTARRIWDHLLAEAVEPRGSLVGAEARLAFERVREVVEAHGRPIYEELLRASRERLAGERAKGEYAFAARRRALARIGLTAVRAHRLAQLEREEGEWREEMDRKAAATPDVALVPFLLLRVEGGRRDG